MDRIRARLHGFLASDHGDAIPLVRAAKSLGHRVNAVLGNPICSAEETALRREARIELARVRARGGAATR